MLIYHAPARRPGFSPDKDALTLAVNPARPAASRRAAKRAALYLRSRGVRRAVFQAGFPFLDIFAENGVAPPAPAPLFRALAAPLALAALKELGRLPESACVALAARRPAPELENAVAGLYPRVKKIFFCVESGGEALTRTLLSGYGVCAPCLPAPPRECSIVLEFSPFSGRIPPEIPRLRLYEGAEGLRAELAPAAPMPLPEGFDVTGLLCDMWANRKISPEQARVVSVKFTGGGLTE